ncbi:Kelch repeat-containing protein [Ideonella sp. YS5]|uniref:Kelch repeat-containing protein n=1 Tax=Ideonella sp. YS5 TaxID=3453714 RepID=UPI003EE85000
MRFVQLVTRPWIVGAFVLGLGLCTQAAAVPDVEWVELNAPVNPPARIEGGMAYDGVSKKIILFGGYSVETYLDDTWVLDEAGWAQLDVLGPSARIAPAMAFDEANRRIVLFGGRNLSQKELSDTWIFNGHTGRWKRMHPTTVPPAREHAMMFTDPITGFATLFGGMAWGVGDFNDLWQFDGSDWHELTPAIRPNNRYRAIAALDDHLGKVVIGSGCRYDGSMENSTWTWDGSVFEPVFPTKDKRPTCASASGYSPATRSIVVFGGMTDRDYTSNATYALRGDSWRKLTPATRPASRWGAMGAYHRAARKLFMFGGTAMDASALDDTWSLIAP